MSEQPEIETLKKELVRICHASAMAAYEGDYLRMAKLAAQAMTIKKSIIEAEIIVVVE